jgi:hypothetical protein
MRTIVDLTDEQIAALAAHCEREGISRAEAVRQAVDLYLADHGVGEIDDDAFGSWRGRVSDALAYEDEMRGPRDEPVRAAQPARRGHRRAL